MDNARPEFSGLVFLCDACVSFRISLRSTIACPHGPISKVVSGPQGKTVENQGFARLDRAGLRGDPKVTRYLTFGGSYSGNSQNSVPDVCCPSACYVPTKPCRCLPEQCGGISRDVEIERCAIARSRGYDRSQSRLVACKDPLRAAIVEDTCVDIAPKRPAWGHRPVAYSSRLQTP
jgi:hypothetical protein